MNIRESLKFISIGLVEMTKVSAVIALIASVIGLTYFLFDVVGVTIALAFVFIIFTAYHIGQIYVIMDSWKSEK
jgi:nicotinamide riboside transporter PnuC